MRILALARLVTRDFQIPLFHHLYPGNVPDVSLFPELARELVEQYGNLTGKVPEATLVFDKGNVSNTVMEQLVASDVRFVAALSANRCKDLLREPIDKFEQINSMAGTQAFDSSLQDNLSLLKKTLYI